MVGCVLHVAVWCSCCFGVLSVTTTAVYGVALFVSCAGSGRLCCELGSDTVSGGGVFMWVGFGCCAVSQV